MTLNIKKQSNLTINDNYFGEEEEEEEDENDDLRQVIFIEN